MVTWVVIGERQAGGGACGVHAVHLASGVMAIHPWGV